MRVAFIAGEYPPMQGGLGDYTRQLALAFASAGHEPHVITKFIAGKPAQESDAGVTVHRLVTAWNWERAAGSKASTGCFTRR